MIYLANKGDSLTRVSFCLESPLSKEAAKQKIARSTRSFDGSLLPGTLLINNPSRESFVFVRASAFALARWCQLALFADRPDSKDIVAQGEFSRTGHTFTASVCVAATPCE